MRVVALMTVRNEELYLERCIRHLVAQGVDVCLIDNGSTDRTCEIASAYLGKGVIRLEEIPFNGQFELEKILRNEERLAAEIDADWFMHHDADEIREAPAPYRTIIEGVNEADRQGYNAINFDEFVFVPTSEDGDKEFNDYVAEMKYYYFFEPAPRRRINLWKNEGRAVDLASAGGHSVVFPERKIFPVPFVMRHYLILSRAHALRKFGTRRYPSQEVARGWHRARVRFSEQTLRFPGRREMCRLGNDGQWDKSNPKHAHLIFPSGPKFSGSIKRVLRRFWNAVT